jgi:hypothetical protein
MTITTRISEPAADGPARGQALAAAPMSARSIGRRRNGTPQALAAQRLLPLHNAPDDCDMPAMTTTRPAASAGRPAMPWRRLGPSLFERRRDCAAHGPASWRPPATHHVPDDRGVPAMTTTRPAASAGRPAMPGRRFRAVRIRAPARLRPTRSRLLAAVCHASCSRRPRCARHDNDSPSCARWPAGDARRRFLPVPGPERRRDCAPHGPDVLAAACHTMSLRPR